MLVTVGFVSPDGTHYEDKTVFRASFISTYRKNGSFIDIHFEKNGEMQRVSVPVREFTEFIQSDDKERRFGLYYEIEMDDPIIERMNKAEITCPKK